MMIERKCISIFIPIECEQLIYNTVSEYYRQKARQALTFNNDDELYDVAAKLCSFKHDTKPTSE